MRDIQSREIDGVVYSFEDFSDSCVRLATFNELEKDYYNFSRIKFSKNDIIFDIGANIGMVSVFLAKKYPETKIYSFEPIPENYKSLIKNIKLNKIENITPFNIGVSKDSTPMKFIMRTDNTGGGTRCSLKTELDDHFISNIDCSSLDDLMVGLNVENIKFMKMDCEGSEYDILFNSSNLNRIEYLSCELHINTNLQNQGYSPDKLLHHVYNHIDQSNVTHYFCRMTD